ncbi:hypothetical protein K378_01793 [Streptomyces sp. Amel2xB2]|uniref:hypothetical protein n=1 Tax=Streptomyces sp. Amel2xB2 TaxID=1305829 RepID=UPI000DBA8DD3|nr:hypothetical protein [Streptomyces sp. Amel2xB2]RAJ68904.1 hypothetical protein K378_01793 [Streptomyces sp. Amel2xB2]
MAVFLAIDAVLLLIIGSLTWVLVRRQRRRGALSDEGLRIESAAGVEVREARQRTRAGRRMGAVSTTPYLRQRDR